MARRRVIVVGAGAAGLMAAGQAAEAGAETLLLEKMDRPACKLSITGNRRCNLTHTAPIHEFLGHFGPTGRFLRQAFAQFFAPDLMEFFRELGVPLVTEEDGKVFPASNQAKDVVNALLQWTARQGVVLRTRSPVTRLLVEHGILEGVEVSSPASATKSRTVASSGTSCIDEADAVILATGGASYPGTGSSGDGYRLAASVGHAVVPIRAALVGLDTAGDAKQLQGVTLDRAIVTLLADEKKMETAAGEIVFTHYGLSGPPILSLSRRAVDALRAGRKVSLSIDLIPDSSDFATAIGPPGSRPPSSSQTISALLRGLLPRKLAEHCVVRAAIAPDKRLGNLSNPERRALMQEMKGFRLDVIGHRPLEEAIVTAGGVDTREVNPRTMESRIVSGLYFAGEILDVDADTGGFNLQAAFSTGWLAGRAAATPP